MAKHVMTAGRRAALRKAQLASARKRKGKRSGMNKPQRAAFHAGRTALKIYQKGQRGPGSYNRRVGTRFKSTGYYDVNYHYGPGKNRKPSKFRKGYRKVSTVTRIAASGGPAGIAVIHGTSAYRGHSAAQKGIVNKTLGERRAIRKKAKQ